MTDKYYCSINIYLLLCLESKYNIYDLISKNKLLLNNTLYALVIKHF